jgi:hypothetical protein
VHEFSQSLDAMRRLASRANLEISSTGGDITNSNRGDVTILGKTWKKHADNLRQIGQEARDMETKFLEKRETEEWLYYRQQTSFVFGSDPDNQGLNSIANATLGLAPSLEHWASLDDKGRPSALSLLDSPVNEAQGRLQTFIQWEQGCEARIVALRQNLN